MSCKLSRIRNGLIALALSPLALMAQINHLPALSGRVSDANSLPLPGARIRLVNTLNGETVESATAPDGRYGFSCLKIGTYQAEYALEGFYENTTKFSYYYPGSVVIDQVLSPVITFEYDLQPLTVVVIESETGTPVDNARVAMGTQRGITDECGRTWGGPASGIVPIVVTKDGYERFEGSVTLVEGEKQQIKVELEKKTLK